MKLRTRFAPQPHHAFVKTFAHPYAKDRRTEWWTIDSEEKCYELRDKIPFTNQFCHNREGGFVVYLDKPLDALTQLANSLTPEQYIRLLDIVHPIPATERAELDKLSDDELVRELTA